MTVTAVIPTYRRPHLLERAIQSVLAQTHRDLRIRVYDNDSGDTTADVVRRFADADARVSYFAHTANIGATQNFQFGMNEVETPYFSCLSDDDVLFPDFYETALAAFEREPDALMSVCSTLEFTPHGRFLYAPVALWPRAGRYDPPEGALAMLGNRHATWTGIVFRSSVLDDVGTIDAEVGAPADLDFELRVAVRFPFVISFDPCAAYLNHATSVSAGEDASVIDGYRRMASNLANDDRLSAALRERLASMLHAQMRRKLIEIVVKGLCAGKDDVAGIAADALAAEHPESLETRIALATFNLCRKWPAARAALGAVERARVRGRAAESTRATLRRSGVDPSSFAHYVQTASSP